MENQGCKIEDWCPGVPVACAKHVDQLKIEAAELRDFVEAAKVARAAWIHHVCGPDILKALWKVERGSAVCSHTIAQAGEAYTAPGVGAAGYSYCIRCGEKRPVPMCRPDPCEGIFPDNEGRPT